MTLLHGYLGRNIFCIPGRRFGEWGKWRGKKQPPATMNTTTRSCQDGRRNTVHGPITSPASTPDLFGDSQDASPKKNRPPDRVTAAPGKNATDIGKQPTLLEVLAIMKLNHTDLKGKVDGLKIDLTITWQHMQKIHGWHTETEQRISNLEDTIYPTLPKLNTHGGEIVTLKDKVDDLRMNNLHLVGLPEQVEGSDPESWLEQEFGCNLLSPRFVIEMAHRVPVHLLPEVQDCDSNLGAAKKKGGLQINTAVVSLYTDYSVTVCNRSASYQCVKQKLWEQDIQYSMLFPATLWVTHQGEGSLLPISAGFPILVGITTSPSPYHFVT